MNLLISQFHKKYHSLFVALISSLPILVLFYYIPNFGDDIVNQRYGYLYNTPIKDLFYVLNQYKTWSSRIIINFFMYAFETMPKCIFVLVVGACYVLLVTSLSNIFNGNYKKKIASYSMDWLIVLSIYCLPFTSLHTAGWIATTVTYFMPVCLASYSLTSLFENEKSNSYVSYILMTFGTLIAANNEQVMIFLLITFALLFVFRRSSINCLSLLQFMALIIDLVIFILSPGNKARNVLDIKRYFPEFSNLSIINKVDIGIMSTSQHFVFGFIISYLVLLTACTLYWVHQSKSAYIRKYVTIFSYLITIICGVAFLVSIRCHKFTRILSFPRLGFLKSSQPVTFVSFMIILSISFYVAVFVICSVHNTLSDNLTAYVLLFAGIISRIAVCLSATQYVSASRTFFVMEFSLLLVAIIVEKQIIINGIGLKTLLIYLSIFASINVVVWIITLNMQLNILLKYFVLWIIPYTNS